MKWEGKHNPTIHRTLGERAWCGCGTYCYPDEWCYCCHEANGDKWVPADMLAKGKKVWWCGTTGKAFARDDSGWVDYCQRKHEGYGCGWRILYDPKGADDE